MSPAIKPVPMTPVMPGAPCGFEAQTGGRLWNLFIQSLLKVHCPRGLPGFGCSLHQALHGSFWSHSMKVPISPFLILHGGGPTAAHIMSTHDIMSTYDIRPRMLVQILMRRQTLTWCVSWRLPGPSQMTARQHACGWLTSASHGAHAILTLTARRSCSTPATSGGPNCFESRATVITHPRPPPW